MSKSTYPLKLPTSVKNAAAELAKLDGVSLNQFIAAAVAEKVGTIAPHGTSCTNAPVRPSRET
jgi:predicted HicB family RNase H-like nuclease